MLKRLLMLTEYPDEDMTEIEFRNIDFLDIDFSEFGWDEKGSKHNELEEASEHITPSSCNEYVALPSRMRIRRLM